MLRLALYHDAIPILILDTPSRSVREKVANSIRPYLDIGKPGREPITLEMSKIESKSHSPE